MFINFTCFKVNIMLRKNDIFKKIWWLWTCDLMFNSLKSVCNFNTKICDLINNYVHYGKNQLCQESRYRYLCLNAKPLNNCMQFLC